RKRVRSRRACARDPKRASPRLAIALMGPSAANMSMNGEPVTANITREPMTGAIVARAGNRKGDGVLGGKGRLIRVESVGVAVTNPLHRARPGRGRSRSQDVDDDRRAALVEERARLKRLRA